MQSKAAPVCLDSIFQIICVDACMYASSDGLGCGLAWLAQLLLCKGLGRLLASEEVLTRRSIGVSGSGSSCSGCLHAQPQFTFQMNI